MPNVRDLLMVFARVPLPGSCKTRLAASIGEEAAARVAEAFLRETLSMGGRTGRDLELHFTPAHDACRVMQLAPSGWTVRPQSEGDLGSRMTRAFAEAFQRRYRRAVLIGSDSPQLEASTVERAFELLGEADAVLGPAADGGYYLVALRAPCPELFTEVPWSTGAVLSTTLARCRSLGLAVELLPRLRDVDELEDLRALADDLEASGRSPHLLQICREALAAGKER